jgi:hypothetical protein
MKVNRPWRVCYSDRVRRDVAALLKRALGVGLALEVVQALKRLDLILHTRPEEFGEETYRLAALHLQVRVGCQQPLFVRYAVHETLPIVFVIGIEPLPRSGLE